MHYIEKGVMIVDHIWIGHQSSKAHKLHSFLNSISYSTKKSESILFLFIIFGGPHQSPQTQKEKRKGKKKGYNIFL
jgi:hypothetical protein